jgi:pectate lyase
MKLSILSPTVALLSQLVSGIPTPTENLVGHVNLAKRATITDIADLGYAQQNGG